MALFGVMRAGAVSLVVVKTMDLNLGYALGLCSRGVGGWASVLPGTERG